MSLLVSALSGVFGLAGGLGGVALLWHLQERTRKEDQQHKARDQKREAALQIYEELDAIADANGALGTAYLELLKDDPNPETVKTVPLGRLRGLLSIYFPEGLKLFQEHDSQMIDHGRFLRESLKTAMADNPKGIKHAGFGYLALLQMQNTKLVSDVRAFMDERSKDLI